MNILITILIVIVTIVLLVMFVTNKNKKEEASISLFILGTLVELKAYGVKSKLALEVAEKRLKEIDDKMSVFKEASQVSRLNKSAGIKGEIVSKDTYLVIKEGIKYSKMSKGSFDITVGPVIKAWGIGKENARVPDKEELEEKLKLVNYEDIILRDNTREIMLKKEGQTIDLGGIAKGYAADEIIKIFKQMNIATAIINLGGNVVTMGYKEDGSNFKVGIQNPLGERNDFVGILELTNKSVVTSGNYERYSIIDRKKYGHIIDARNGRPYEGEIISVTVVSDLSIDGDGLSTGLYLLGVNRGMELVQEMKGIDVVFITKEREVFITAGIKDNFKLYNREFKLGTLNRREI